MNDLPHFINNYILHNVVGSGSFATVVKATHVPTDRQVALKIFKKSAIKDRIKLQNEISFLKQLDHPYACLFFESFEDEHHIYLSMEFLPGKGLAYLISNTSFPEEKIRHYFHQLVCVVRYLHEDLKIVHRDLKPENVMIDENDNIRLIDFGLSNQFNDNTFLQSSCGSPGYASPEMYKGNKYSTSVDIWSLGILLYFMAYKVLPFHDNNLHNLASKICFNEPEYSSDVSPLLNDLIKKMLIKDPDLRIRIQGIESHPWCQAESIPVILPTYQMYRNPKDPHSFNPDNLVINDIKKQISPEAADLAVQAMEKGEFNSDSAIYRIEKRFHLVQEMRNNGVKSPEFLKVSHSFNCSNARTNLLPQFRNVVRDTSSLLDPRARDREKLTGVQKQSIFYAAATMNVMRHSIGPTNHQRASFSNAFQRIQSLSSKPE